MRKLIEDWSSLIGRQPVVLLPLLCFLVTVYMNAHAGYLIGGHSVVLAAVLIAVAFYTAYAGTTVWNAGGWRKFFLGVVLVGGLAVDQIAAWQTLGIQFADGQTARATKAQGLGATADALKRARDERDSIGRVRAIGAIDADRVLECRRTSPSFPDGRGPQCTRLTGELETARRAAALDGDIVRLIGETENREQVAGGTAQFTVPQALAQNLANVWWGPKAAPKVSPDDVLFFVLILLAAAIGLLANLGFWLVGVAHDASSDDDHKLGSGADVDLSLPSTLSGVPVDLAPLRLLEAPPRRRQLSPPAALMPAAATPAQPTLSTASAPINITLGYGVPPSASAVPPTAVPAEPAARSRSEKPLHPRPDVNPVASAPPVDRGPVQAIVDNLTAFRAACVVDAPGVSVSRDQMWRRYCAWAGDRAASRQVFDALFAEMAEVLVERDAFHDVALRAGSMLEAVA
jgi:hypothetical protein